MEKGTSSIRYLQRRAREHLTFRTNYIYLSLTTDNEHNDFHYINTMNTTTQNQLDISYLAKLNISAVCIMHTKYTHFLFTVKNRACTCDILSY